MLIYDWPDSPGITTPDHVQGHVRDEVPGPSCRWIDLFKSFPSLGKKLPVEVFLQLVPLMHARYYSIASSPWKERDQASLPRHALKPPRISVQDGARPKHIATSCVLDHMVDMVPPAVGSASGPCQADHLCCGLSAPIAL